jgi:uncharacterized membrane protein
VSEFVLAAYDREDTAEHVLGVLRAHSDELPADLDAVAVVRLGADDGFTLTTTDRPGLGSSVWGVFFEALFGLVFLVPTPGTAYEPNLGGLFGTIDRAGLDDDFRARVRAALRRPGSGLGFLATDWSPQLVLDQLYLRPDTLLRTSLSTAQDAEVVRELGGVRPHTGGEDHG